MNHGSFPGEVYASETASIQKQLLLLKKRKNAIAWGRFGVILLLAAIIYFRGAFAVGYTVAAAVLLIALFIRLVLTAVNNSAGIANYNLLLGINQQETAIAGGEYLHLPDGAPFLSPLHPYANDLDIFGKASVYQYTNRSQSEQGNALYAAWLQQPAGAAEIIQRQEAVKEMAPKFQWRQQLQAHGTAAPISIATEKKIQLWLAEADQFSHQWYWRLLRWLYPAIAVLFIILYMTDIITGPFFFMAYIIFFLTAGWISRMLAAQYMQLGKIVPEVSTLRNSAAWVETGQFQSAWIQQVQSYFTAKGALASVSIKQLKNILDNFDLNLNLLFMLLVNPFILWNLQTVFRLEQWRAANKERVSQWFDALAATEAMSSLANIHFNHPHWAFPEIDGVYHGTLSATGLAHPLIPEKKCVRNNFTTTGEAKIALVTGSNMAGKSTFLRSIGVNTVLAMMGSTVCANAMTISVMRIISSMRVADNLQESTSTFYAELKKLQSIIAAVNAHERVFVLLDEILRGTNSLDRHTGSKALVKQLIKQQAVAMLATHDVELAQLQSDYPDNIHNYHFDARIANEELYFDYTLKEGICRSINASILMKKIGIEL
jgi:hypothetical protein